MRKILFNVIVISTLMMIEFSSASGHRRHQDEKSNDETSSPLNASLCSFDSLDFEMKLYLTGFLRPKQSLVISEINREFNTLTKDPAFWQQQLKNLGDVEFAHDLMRSFPAQAIVEQAIVYHNIFLQALKGNTQKAKALLRRIDPKLNYLDFENILDVKFITDPFIHQSSLSLKGTPEYGVVTVSRALNTNFIYIFYENMSELINRNHIGNVQDLMEHYDNDYNDIDYNLENDKTVRFLNTALLKWVLIELLEKNNQIMIEKAYMSHLNNFFTINNFQLFKSYMEHVLCLLKTQYCLGSTITLHAYTVVKNFEKQFKEYNYSVINQAFEARKSKDPIFKILASCLPYIDKHDYKSAIDILEEELEIYPTNKDLMHYKIDQMRLDVERNSEKQNQYPDYSSLKLFLRDQTQQKNSYVFTYLIRSLMEGNTYFEKDEVAAQEITDQFVEQGYAWAIQHKIAKVFKDSTVKLHQTDLEAIKNLIEAHSTDRHVKLFKVFGMLMGALGYEQAFDAAVKIIEQEEIMPYKLNIRPTFDKSSLPQDPQ